MWPSECKNPIKDYVWEKGYVWNPSTSTYENDKYLGNIIDDALIHATKLTNKNYTNKF